MVSSSPGVSGIRLVAHIDSAPTHKTGKTRFVVSDDFSRGFRTDATASNRLTSLVFVGASAIKNVIPLEAFKRTSSTSICCDSRLPNELLKVDLFILVSISCHFHGGEESKFKHYVIQLEDRFEIPFYDNTNGDKGKAVQMSARRLAATLWDINGGGDEEKEEEKENFIGRHSHMLDHSCSPLCKKDGSKTLS